MKRLSRYHKVAFTGLMNNEKTGEWCKWRDVEDLIHEHRLEDFEASEEFIKRRACYRNCYLMKLKVSLFINAVLIIIMFGV